MSMLITLDSSQLPQYQSDDFTVYYPNPISLGDDQWEAALVSANLWYSFHNIAADFSNNTLRYSPDGGATWEDVTIPAGAYQIEQLDEELKRQMKANGDYNGTDPANEIYYISLIPNFATLKLRIEVSNNYQLDLSSGNLHDLLGFNAIVVTTTQEGVEPVDITRGVNTMLIRTDLVAQSYNNSLAGDILSTFVPDTIPGGNIDLEPNQRIYLPVRYNKQILSIRMYITDQLNRRVNFNGEPVTYQLHLRKIREF